MAEKLRSHSYAPSLLLKNRVWHPMYLETVRHPSVLDHIIDLAWAWRDYALGLGVFDRNNKGSEEYGRLADPPLSFQIRTLREALWNRRLSESSKNS